jgi:hypothetical protein
LRLSALVLARGLAGRLSVRKGRPGSKAVAAVITRAGAVAGGYAKECGWI